MLTSVDKHVRDGLQDVAWIGWTPAVISVGAQVSAVRHLVASFSCPSREAAVVGLFAESFVIRVSMNSHRTLSE
jgi:hypothetical protein